ncbi:hypothetical protein Hanom_Chr04g00312141 [Helianthus anomalus]
MERIPACIRKLTWNCCHKLLEAKKKGKMYGIGTTVDSRVVMMGAQERSDNDDIEKHAMMEKIEEAARLYAEMKEKIQMLAQNPPPT